MFNWCNPPINATAKAVANGKASVQVCKKRKMQPLGHCQKQKVHQIFCVQKRKRTEIFGGTKRKSAI